MSKEDYFAPKGERARWLYLYDMLCATETNGVLEYADMAKALGPEVDPDTDKGKQVIRQALYRAAKEHEQVGKRAIVAVKNVGYRVVEPQEHLGLARRHQRRSGKQLVKAQSKAVNVDFSKMEPEARKAIEMVAQVLAMQADFNKRAESKLSQHDKAIKELVVARDRTDAEREEFRQRLERLEQLNRS